MAARKRVFRDNLSSCSDESREDFTEEQAAGTLDDFAAVVYDENLKAVRILQDDKKTHQAFEPTLNNKEILNKTGPRVKGFLKKCKNRCQAQYKRRNRIQAFEPTLNNKEILNKTGPRVKGFLKKCKNRCQAQYKRRNRILKSIRDLKIVAGDDTVVGFLKHPIDGGTDKLMVYSTFQKI